MKNCSTPARANPISATRATAAAIAFVILIALLSVALPLATYTLSLAAFGLPHVLTELRYVDARFNARLDSELRLGILQLLFLIATLRFLQVFYLIPSSAGILLELSCVIALIALVVPVLARRGWGFAIFGIGAIAAITAGTVTAPAQTLLIFAILHNLTPIGFLAERLRGKHRHFALIACAIAFAAIPLIILSGIPYSALASIHLVAPEASLLPAGGLSDHLGVFVPPQLHSEAIALHAFSAAVFLQCMHYAAVIGILPRFDNNTTWAKPRAFFPWPHPNRFHCLITIIGALLFIGFAVSFRETRAIYGIAAAIHAWVEIPLLLLALALPAESAAHSD